MRFVCVEFVVQVLLRCAHSFLALENVCQELLYTSGVWVGIALQPCKNLCSCLHSFLLEPHDLERHLPASPAHDDLCRLPGVPRHQHLDVFSVHRDPIDRDDFVSNLQELL
jgi:hypothetical protein